jgi:hypothetical protein
MGAGAALVGPPLQGLVPGLPGLHGPFLGRSRFTPHTENKRSDPVAPFAFRPRARTPPRGRSRRARRCPFVPAGFPGILALTPSGWRRPDAPPLPLRWRLS